MTATSVGGIARETLVTPAATPLAVSTVARETLYAQPPPPLLIAAVVRETLMPGFAIVRACVFT